MQEIKITPEHKNKLLNNMETTVYVVHHTNQGTPESGEIYGIYATEELALQAMSDCLKNDYESSLEENEEEDYMYMYISEQSFHS